MPKGIMILFLFLSQVVLRAQNTFNKDSLLKELRTANEDTLKVTTLLKIAKLYETNNQDSALYYLAKTKQLAESLKYTRGIFNYYEQVSIVSWTKGDYSKSMDENNQALILARTLKDSSLVIIALNHIGIVYGLQQRFKEQLDY